MKSALERFLKYVTINTQSDEESKSTPSTKGQWDLARLLKDELEAMGVESVTLDDKCYLYALIPANTLKRITPIGFVAHLDTSPDESGEGVVPVIDTLEDGTEIVRSNGDTLLGADDKSGVAAIMSAMEYLIENPEIKHGDIYIAFTPDEEIGRGTDFFNKELFKARFAYTVDGGEEGELEVENFNASRADIDIYGKNCHPGYAKGIMVNSLNVASHIAETISSDHYPETTDGYKGFFHLYKMSGDVNHTRMSYLLRDFSIDDLNSKEEFIKDIARDINEKISDCTVVVNITKQYQNMFSVIQKHPDVIRCAKEGMAAAGVTPVMKPIRGGTDGVKLSFMGIPCPNLFAGGINFHSRDEYIKTDTLNKVQATIVGIVRAVAK